MGYAETGERAPIVVQEVRHYLLPPDAIYDLPRYRPRRRGVRAGAIAGPILVLLSCLLLATAAFVLWPSQPTVQVEHWKLNGISFASKGQGKSVVPAVYLTVSLDVVLQITNPNFVGVRYDFLSVEVLYRGSYVGDVTLEGGRIPARRTVLVPAVLNLQACEILESAAELLADVARGEVPLTTHVKIVGDVDFQLFLRPHIDVDLDCDVVIDPKTEFIIRESCGLDIFEGTQLRRRHGAASAPSYVS